MLALRRMTIETEFVKWIALLLAAAAIAMLLATRMAGADNAPGLLPYDMDRVAAPLDPTEADAPFHPEFGPAPQQHDLNRALWRVIELHRYGQVEEAIAAWNKLALPCETEAWKELAVGAACLQAGQLDLAEERLTTALELEPNNGAVHYFVGMLRLAQAENARNWRDAMGPPILLIALPAVAPNTKAMYELAAVQEMEQAIELAEKMDVYAPLAPLLWTNDGTQNLPLVTPTVNDLLTALGADHYPMRAHNVLGEMYREHGQLDEAEAHIDAAAAQAMNQPRAYRELGAAFAEEERFEDAARVYLKAFRNGDPNVVPVIRMFENAWKAGRGN